MPDNMKKTILITGCSDGGLGAALSFAFHNIGWLVFATGRNPSRMSELSSAGLEILQLDVLSEASIAACANEVSRLSDGKLDCLINNAGAVSGMPVSDVSIDAAKNLFDLNFWSIYAVTQAFLPLLQKSDHGAMVINHTSLSAQAYLPFYSVYNASKAAAAMLTNTMRLEFAPLKIRVHELKTGRVRSRIFENAQQNSANPGLPPHSLYIATKDAVELGMSGWHLAKDPDNLPQATEEWAFQVVEALQDPNAPPIVAKGKDTELPLPETLFPSEVEELFKKLSGLDVFEKRRL